MRYTPGTLRASRTASRSGWGGRGRGMRCGTSREEKPNASRKYARSRGRERMVLPQDSESGKARHGLSHAEAAENAENAEEAAERGLSGRQAIATGAGWLGDYDPGWVEVESERR